MKKQGNELSKVEEYMYNFKEAQQVIEEIERLQVIVTDHILRKHTVGLDICEPRKIKPPVPISIGGYEYIKEKYPELLDEYDFCVYCSVLDLDRMVMKGVNYEQSDI